MTRARPLQLAAGVVVTTVCVFTLGGLADPPTSQPAWQPPADRAAVWALIEMLGRDDVDPDRASVRRILAGPALEIVGPPQWKPIENDPETARARAIAARAEFRAFDGAPPLMPHSRNFAQRKTCLDCHTDGIKIGERYGPPVSHPLMPNCQQCHVESTSLDLPRPGGSILNNFEGIAARHEGARAYAGAPPVMPHGTFMRTRCVSCHGPSGASGLITSHPERLNCVQCHAVSADFDQTSPFFGIDAATP